LAGAASYPNDVKTESDSILLVNMDSGQTVYEKDADSKRYPASTTKIMTYIIAVENIADLDNTKIPIKQSVLDVLKNTGSSLANVENHVGKSMTAIDLLYSMMVPSGNDAAMVLADYIGEGNVDNFVKLMNEKAKELGCENTHFANPDGLHDPDHYTTARDMYKITTYALTLPRFEEITNTCTYTCDGDDTALVTTNYLIDANRGGEYYYMYANGIKTGTTDQAGRCLVTSASADGYSYLLVLLKAPYKEGVDEEYYTFTDAADLFRWALTSLELNTVASTKTPVCEQKVKLSWGKDSVLLVPEKNFSAIVPSDYQEKWITVETNVPDEVNAPLDTDTVVGTATIYYQDDKMTEKQELATVNLVPSEKVELSGFLYVLDVIGTIMKSYWFLVAVGVIVVILLIYYITSKINRKKAKAAKKVKHYRNL
jgi:D-alanyl-D-alanine carboxypeptidase (penicillin-binding protein 5/6)